MSRCTFFHLSISDTPSKYFASFGGLLLYMEGPFKKLTGLKIDNIYMLLKHS